MITETILADGSGGTIITWYDSRNSNVYDIFAQRINSTGTTVWATDGVDICTAPGEQRYPTITSDGSGGAIITWQDDRNSNTDIYAQRINSNGAGQWGSNGLALCTATGNQTSPTITSDASGGAFISWSDYRNGNADVYAQRVDENGGPLWTVNGLPLCALPSIQTLPSITSDGSGGAIITWYDSRNGSGGGYSDVYAQKINSSGASQWTIDGNVVCTNFAAQYSPTITNVGSQGAIMAWYDYRANNNDIYASKIFSNGELPVELTTFTYSITAGNAIVLNWSTATEVNNFGFDIQRSATKDESGNTKWQNIWFVKGNGTSNISNTYSFTDRNPIEGNYWYRLKQIDNDGKYQYSKLLEVTTLGTPTVFALSQNYPNPFNPSTEIIYTIASPSNVTLKVYDLLGHEVATLVDETKESGKYVAQFDGTKYSSGLYFYAIKAGSFKATKKLLLMR